MKQSNSPGKYDTRSLMIIGINSYLSNDGTWAFSINKKQDQGPNQLIFKCSKSLYRTWQSNLSSRAFYAFLPFRPKSFEARTQQNLLVVAVSQASTLSFASSKENTDIHPSFAIIVNCAGFRKAREIFPGTLVISQ